MLKLKYIAVALALASVTPLCRANSIISNPGPGLVTTAINPTTAGFDFTVGSTALQVTALGLWDQNRNGFTNAHDIGLWDNSGNLLAQVSVSAGTTNQLVGDFRYVSLATPVVLNAGATYVLGATFRNADLDRVISNFSGNQATFDPSVLPGNYRQIVGSSSLLFPNQNIQPGSAVGANAIFSTVPEGGPGILPIAFLFGALFLAHRKFASVRRPNPLG
jgi:hypothetical protein